MNEKNKREKEVAKLSANPLKLLVMAWDGASPEIILEHRNRLPTLNWLCQKGSYGVVRSGVCSYDIWMTYYTGKMPEKHGFQLLKLRDMYRQNFALHSLKHVRCQKFFWDYVNEAGLTIGIFGALGTFPAPKVNGFIVSGELLFGHHDEAFYPPEIQRHFQEIPQILHSIQAERPQETQEYLKKSLFGYRDPSPLATLGLTRPFPEITVQELEEVLNRPYFDFALAALEDKIKIYRRKLEEITRIIPVDVLFIYFIDLDIIQHFSFHEQDLGTILQGYCLLDRALQEFIEEYHPANVLVISDHGVEPYTKFIHRVVEGEELPPVLKRLSNGAIIGEAANHGIISGAHAVNAFYVLKGEEVKPDNYQQISFINVLPMLLRTLRINITPGLDGKTPGIFLES
jgi:predicted AlkP superfamily pyrophosphatase or phosphodiesterase